MMEARYMTDLEWRICHAVNIYLYRNGKDGEAPILVHIPPAKKKNMRTVMNVIQERVKFPVGFAAYLYKMDGNRVRHPCELEMYNNYVVASNYDKFFKCAQYGRKRSPLLVLNRESKHIRVLRQQNQNYYEWSLKKKAVGEERPQYIYPAFFTNENAMPQDLPVGQLGNYMPPPPNQYQKQGEANPNMGMGGPQMMSSPPPQQMYPPQQQQQQQMPPQSYSQQQNNYRVNTCIVDQAAIIARQQLFSQQYPPNNIANEWGGQQQLKDNNCKPTFLESDIRNANTCIITDNPEEKDGNNETCLDSCTTTDNAVNSTSGSESVLDTDCLGSKYQKMLKRFKKKLKRQAIVEAQSSLSSMNNNNNNIQVKSRNHCKVKYDKPGTTGTITSASATEEDDEGQIIVLPPPPIEFRDGIIPRGGTFYSFLPPL